MNTNSKVHISWIEAVSLLTVSQIFSTIAFSLESQNGLSAISGMLAFVIGTLFDFVIIIPFILLSNRFGYNSPLQLSFKLLGKAFGCIVSVILLAYLILVATSTVTVYEGFLTATLFQDSPSAVIISLLIFASAYGVYLGIEALGRFANIVFLLVSISVFVILLSLIKNINILNFGSTNLEDVKTILKTAVQDVLSNTGLIAALILASNVNKKHSKSFLFWNIASLLIVETIAFSVNGVLGEYALGKEYPYYNAATIAEFSIFKRLDIVYMCVWILVAFIKTAYYLLLAKNVLDNILQVNIKKYSLLFCSTVDFLLSFACSLQPKYYEYIKVFIGSGFVLIGFVVLLPFILLLKGRKSHENV